MRTAVAAGERDVADIDAHRRRPIVAEPLAKLEYFEIVDSDRSSSPFDRSEPQPALAVTAAWIGDVRLIDNLAIVVTQGSR